MRPGSSWHASLSTTPMPRSRAKATWLADTLPPPAADLAVEAAMRLAPRNSTLPPAIPVIVSVSKTQRLPLAESGTLTDAPPLRLAATAAAAATTAEGPAALARRLAVLEKPPVLPQAAALPLQLTELPATGCLGAAAATAAALAALPL
eukprot:365592-Chlamydomonas_euryale.AAC.4